MSYNPSGNGNWDESGDMEIVDNYQNRMIGMENDYNYENQMNGAVNQMDEMENVADTSEQDYPHRKKSGKRNRKEVDKQDELLLKKPTPSSSASPSSSSSSKIPQSVCTVINTKRRTVINTKMPASIKCIHSRNKYTCKDCGGGGIC